MSVADGVEMTEDLLANVTDDVEMTEDCTARGPRFGAELKPL